MVSVTNSVYTQLSRAVKANCGSHIESLTLTMQALRTFGMSKLFTIRCGVTYQHKCLFKICVCHICHSWGIEVRYFTQVKLVITNHQLQPLAPFPV